MTVLPLSGITVLELSHTVMGPACGLMLARMDAADLNVKLLAVVPSPEVRRVLTQAGLDSVLPAYASVTEALAVAYLNGSPGATG